MMHHSNDHPTFNRTLDHRIDMVSLAIVVLVQKHSFFSCLIRSDFNFVVILFCYFIWQQRKDALILRLIMVTIIVLFIFDLIFLLTQIHLWNQADANNQVWETLRPMHTFGIICFIIINIFKVVLLVLVCQGLSEANKAVQNI